MKKYIIIIVLSAFFAACGSGKKLAANYQTLLDKDKKMLSGIVTRPLIENDTAFAWFKENMQYGNPEPTAITAFQQNKDKFTMVVFGGTWCSDTQNLLPKFYKLIDKSGYPESKITLVALDRKKESSSDKNLHTVYAITNVPTFIVLQNGKEIGRVTEYGKMNDITKELGEMVALIK